MIDINKQIMERNGGTIITKERLAVINIKHMAQVDIIIIIIIMGVNNGVDIQINIIIITVKTWSKL